MDISALIQALRIYFAAPEGDPTAEAARGVNEQVAQGLPSAVMPLDATQKQKDRLAMIDQQMADAQR